MGSENIWENHLYISLFIYPLLSLKMLITETNKKQTKDQQRGEIFTRNKILMFVLCVEHRQHVHIDMECL